MSNMSLILEDDFFNDTIHKNIQTEEYNFISSSDPDSTKIEWRLPLAVIFAIIMIIYLVIVIVILSGSDISLRDTFSNIPLSVSKRSYIRDTFPVISGSCSDLCGSCSHCSSCDYCWILAPMSGRPDDSIGCHAHNHNWNCGGFKRDHNWCKHNINRNHRFFEETWFFSSNHIVQFHSLRHLTNFPNFSGL